MTSALLAWGPEGAASLAPDVDVLVVVDVLSFTTCVSIAATRDARVRPAPLDPLGAIGDDLAERDAERPSLSPQSMLRLAPGTEVVLRSVNGAAIAAAAAVLDVPLVVACLRNASTVAAALPDFGERAGIIAAGERWPDGRLRPAYEDVVGAGAVLAALGGQQTPQAEAAAIAFRDVRAALSDGLLASRSGVELAQRGFAEDVALAAALDADDVVPVLRDSVFSR